jgi:MFS family permease
LRDILKDRNIRAAYLLCLTLGTAYGMVMAIVSLYLTKERAYDEVAIAELATFFTLAIAAFAVPMGMLVRRLSPRVTLAIALLGYGLATAAFPFMPGFIGLGAARGFDGGFSVGAWISFETILLMRTTAINRGLVTSLYSNVLALGYAIGAVLATGITLLWPMTWVFVAAGGLATLGAGYALARIDGDIQPVAEPGEPAPSASAAAPVARSIGIARLLWRIKTACIPVFSYGYFQGSLVLFLPLFLLKERGVAEDATKLLVAYFALGMFVCVSFVGHLGDRFGHLKVIRAVAGLGAVITMGVVYLPNYPLVATAVFLAGGLFGPLWPLSLALQSLISDPHDYGRANGLLNASYALGALSGPLVCGFIFRAYKGEVMFLHLAGMWAVVLLTTLLFRRDDPSLRTRRRPA